MNPRPSDRPVGRTRVSRVALGGLVAIVAAGTALRLIGLPYGLPEVYNPDEVAIMNRAMAFGTGDLNPHNFVYPTFYFYVLFVWEGLFFVAGRATGFFASVAEFERSFFVDPTGIYLAGRAFTVVCGVLTIITTWQLARRALGAGAALAAAALLAAAPLAVRDAHYVKHDVPVTLLVVVTHLLLADVLFDEARRQRLWRWAMLGAVAGLATSTHYYAAFLTIPIGLAALALGDRPDSPAWRLCGVRPYAGRGGASHELAQPARPVSSRSSPRPHSC